MRKALRNAKKQTRGGKFSGFFQGFLKRAGIPKQPRSIVQKKGGARKGKVRKNPNK